MLSRPPHVEPSQLPLFEGVRAELIAALGDRPFRSFTDGDVIFGEGDPGNSMFVVVHGQVKITRDGIHLVIRQANQIVGEQACLERAERSGTATAIGAVQLLEIPQPMFDRLLEDPTFSRNLMVVLSGKLREATSERAIRYAHEQALFSEFRAHVSPEVLDELLMLGSHQYGQPRFTDAIVLFSDIRGFSTQSAAMEPEAVAEQLGAYLDRVVDIVHQHDGLVDKFVGDAVMAIWGLYPTGEDLALQAYRCAEAMVRGAQTMSFGAAPIVIGVGINAGRVFMGNVGSDGKRQFTVLGTPVNIAARLEGQAKELVAPIVVGPDFYDRLPEEIQERLQPHPDVELKGVGTMSCYTGDPVAEETA